jgi:translation elongation factor P/translation initiation factor 5A
MTTYTHTLKVSQDLSLTNSQKLHELFKEAKGTNAIACIIDDISEDEVHQLPELPQDAEVVFIDAGQVYYIRFPDNTYHILDTGTYTTDHKFFSVLSLDKDYDKEDMEYLWERFLGEAGLAFYQGFFIDDEAERKFSASFPQN